MKFKLFTAALMLAIVAQASRAEENQVDEAAASEFNWSAQASMMVLRDNNVFYAPNDRVSDYAVDFSVDGDASYRPNRDFEFLGYGFAHRRHYMNKTAGNFGSVGMVLDGYYEMLGSLGMDYVSFGLEEKLSYHKLRLTDAKGDYLDRDKIAFYEHSPLVSMYAVPSRDVRFSFELKAGLSWWMHTDEPTVTSLDSTGWNSELRLRYSFSDRFKVLGSYRHRVKQYKDYLARDLTFTASVPGLKQTLIIDSFLIEGKYRPADGIDLTVGLSRDMHRDIDSGAMTYRQTSISIEGEFDLGESARIEASYKYSHRPYSHRIVPVTLEPFKDTFHKFRAALLIIITDALIIDAGFSTETRNSKYDLVGYKVNNIFAGLEYSFGSEDE
ncbi:MAG: hypothetical protein NUW37_03135 [Planctomycetes bacterium]|nr:hypothetical protein [Planctomycetota bacterium]